MTTLFELQQEIEARMRQGESFSAVENDIEADSLSEEEKTALWLYAWSFVDWRAQRRQACAYIDHLGRPSAKTFRRTPESRRLRRVG